jgi:hypothetical protein
MRIRGRLHVRFWERIATRFRVQFLAKGGLVFNLGFFFSEMCLRTVVMGMKNQKPKSFLYKKCTESYGDSYTESVTNRTRTSDVLIKIVQKLTKTLKWKWKWKKDLGRALVEVMRNVLSLILAVCMLYMEAKIISCSSGFGEITISGFCPFYNSFPNGPVK